MEDFNQMVGRRISFARKEAELSQEELAARLGFKDRQILSNIESGKRKVASDELLLLMKVLGKDLDYFTDPYSVVGESAMSWRVESFSGAIHDFETWALGLVGLQRQLTRQLRDNASPLKSYLSLHKGSSFEQAWDAAESLVSEWQLGEVPAMKLQSKIEENLKISVLPVDAPDKVSGGTVNLDHSATIFINRKHTRGRRHFTIAHELFHVLTWNNMPPAKIDIETSGDKRPRVELLADNFAGALLMPLEVLVSKYSVLKSLTHKPNCPPQAKITLSEWLRKTARFFQVSTSALKVRLQIAKLVPADVIQKVEANFREDTEPQPAYSHVFLDRINRGIDKGFLSARKAAAQLQTTLDGLVDLLRLHDLEPAFSL